MRLKIITALLTVLISSCTHNNGEIGFLFGSWNLREITINEEKDMSYKGNIVWAFQSSIIKMTSINEHHQTDEYWGTWHESENSLILDFTHSDADSQPGTEEYRFPPDIHLPENGIISLTIIRQEGNRMTLEYKKADGTAVTYRLQKQF